MTSPDQEPPVQELASQQAEQSSEKGKIEEPNALSKENQVSQPEDKPDEEPSNGTPVPESVASADDAQKDVPGSPESVESGEASPIEPSDKKTPAGDEDAPPLPDEPPPEDGAASKDDGWDFHWDETNQAYFFYNRFTNETTWENPRAADGANAGAGSSAAPQANEGPAPPQNEQLPAGGYNPAIHGDYDPNAWYAQSSETTNTAQQDSAAMMGAADPSDAYAAVGSFNAATGRWQGGHQNPGRHTDDAKAQRQMNAYFDTDAAAAAASYAANDGRILGSERSGQKLSKAKLKHYREKNKAKKEEKRRAWLRD